MSGRIASPTLDPLVGNIKIDSSLAQQASDSFLLEFKKLFQRQSSENMYPYLYSTPDPNIENDLARGELHYNDLIYKVYAYYLYRNEVHILQNYAHPLASHVPDKATIVEFGVGTEIAFTNKTLPFLKAIQALDRYVPVDLCLPYLTQAEAILAQELPDVNFYGIQTDFVKNLSLVKDFANPVVFFKGSTITNLSPDICIDFFRRLSDALPSKGILIVGENRNPSEENLRCAYINPPLANLMMSIFHLLKRDFQVENFIPGAFEYRFDWLADRYCVAHMAVATQAQRFELDGALIEIEANDEFHIVSSYKYPVEFFQDMARKGGLNPISLIAEDGNPMVIHILQKQ